MSDKVFSRAKIAQCVQILDQLTQSGLGTQAFAQARGLSYTQLRAWQNHETRWRARLAGQDRVKSAPSAKGFVQVKAGVAIADAALPIDAHSIRIECSHGTRSATLYWPASQGVQCAQWLAAYLE